MQNRSDGDSARLAQVTQELLAHAGKAQELAGLSTTFRPTVPQLFVELDRERAKNAILIVEFAVLERDRGKSVYDAAVSAARLRFCPIVMTSLAFILGVVPLALSTGAGAASRHSIGTGVIGGMLAATVIATLLVPFFYILLTRRKELKPANEPEPGPAEGEPVKGSGS